jgi:hypothetical protein
VGKRLFACPPIMPHSAWADTIKPSAHWACFSTLWFIQTTQTLKEAFEEKASDVYEYIEATEVRAALLMNRLKNRRGKEGLDSFQET